MSQPQLMGILNVTPDSFSDGGQFASPDAAIAQYAQLLADGADWVDIGAESTRPSATLLSAEEEWARLAPVLKGVDGTRVSVDTRHWQTAAACLAQNVGMVNDEGGLQCAQMRAVLASSTCEVVVMHALSLPADPKLVWADDLNPIEEILRWKLDVTARATAAGIAAERLIFDPGIGFGKTPAQSLALIEGAAQLVKSGGRWLYGHSRKSFLTLLTDAPAAERDAATLELSITLAAAGVQYLRVHNVALHREGLCM